MSTNTTDQPSSTSADTSPTNQQATDAQGQFTAAVDELLDQLQHKFDAVSREMFGKFDDMARRLDELEASLSVVGDGADTTAAAAAGAGAGAGATAAGSSK